MISQGVMLCDNMDEPINVQGTARGMLDKPMAVLF
jgi:hypothetical protein